MFANHQESHQHSLETLNLLYEYDDFMESIDTVVDLGCGAGLDLEWWASRTTRDETRRPLNINCTGVDVENSLSIAKTYRNIIYQKNDFEHTVDTPLNKKYDILWCHDSFQYALNPLQTLSKWWHITNNNGMLILIVPQTTNFVGKKSDIYSSAGCYYHYTLTNMIYMLATAGWDCRSGFFLKRPNENWLNIAVYRSDIEPQDPKTTSWYNLREKKLLPESADACVFKYGMLKQQELTLPWLDRSLTWYGNQ